jgi:hypothetical protein
MPQVTQRVPEIGNALLAGIPRTLDVKGLELNISLAGDPLVRADSLVIRDWGRFQSPFRAAAAAWDVPALAGAAAGMREQQEQGSSVEAQPHAVSAEVLREVGEERRVLGAVRWDDEAGLEDSLGVAGGNRGRGQGAVASGQGSLGDWKECPYRRALSEEALLGATAHGGGFARNKDPMIVGIIDQSIANWCAPPFISPIYPNIKITSSHSCSELPGRIVNSLLRGKSQSDEVGHFVSDGPAQAHVHVCPADNSLCLE